MSQIPPLPGNQPDYQGYEPPEEPGRAKATASLVLGICSTVLWLCPLMGLALSITGLVLGIQSNRACRRGTATAGIVLSIVGLVLSAVNGILGAYLGATGQLDFMNP